ncbi:hypothetical protein PC119_g14280 [Phytophthora cactorum]|nr:hypothetical protein PC119_g14280 [Phytophthora cactorum]
MAGRPDLDVLHQYGYRITALRRRGGCIPAQQVEVRALRINAANLRRSERLVRHMADSVASTRTLCPGYTRCQRARRLFRWRIRTLRLTRDELVNSLAAEHYSRQCSAALQFSTASCMMELLQHQGTWPTRAAHKEGGWRDACNVGINGGAATRTRCTGPGYLSAH